MQVILQVVEVILMVMEQFELHYCLMVDLKNLEVLGDLLGILLDIVLDNFQVVHLVVEQQCWVVLLD